MREQGVCEGGGGMGGSRGYVREEGVCEGAGGM